MNAIKVPVTRSEAEHVAPGLTGMIRDSDNPARFVRPQHPVDKCCEHGNSASRCSRCFEPQRQPSIVKVAAVAPEPPPAPDYVYSASIEDVSKRFGVSRKALLQLDHVLHPQIVAGAGGTHRRYSLRRVREAIESGSVRVALDDLATRAREQARAAGERGRAKRDANKAARAAAKESAP